MHESLIPRNELSVTLGPLVAGGVPDIRGALRSVADSGYRLVQLSGAIAGMRPRELGRSARRDLRALLGRMELTPSGIDMWIPMEHFMDGGQCERAVEALLEVIGLARDLGGIRVSTALPSKSDRAAGGTVDGEGMVRAVADRADACGVVVADYGSSWRNNVKDGAPTSDEELSNEAGALSAVEVIGRGIDPALEILCGRDPATQVLRMSDAVVGARFSDADGVGRVEPGLGRLDILEYQVALVTAGYAGAVVVDGRGLANAESAMRQARSKWGITADEM